MIRLLVCAAALFTIAACNPASKINSDGPPSTASAGATSVGTTAKTGTPTNGERPHPKVIEATADSDAISLIRTRRLEAKAENRVLIVYVSATWCEPCKKFKAELQSGRLDERLGKVTLLAFDVDKDMDRLASAGYAFKFVPFVALPGADGHPADTQQATGKGADAWKELLGKLDAWQAGS